MTHNKDNIEKILPSDDWEKIRSALGGIVEDLKPPKTDEYKTFFLAILDSLAGAYNPEGIRSWFRRPRTHLQNMTPIEALQTYRSLNHPYCQLVKQLASGLRDAPST